MEVRYGEGGPSRYGVLRLPPKGGPPRGVALLFHGGFWKSEWTLQATHSAALLGAFGGLATWEVEYSRVEQARPGGEGCGSWPFAQLDALAALNALGDSTLPAGVQEELDTCQVWLCGHSAGGCLALWLAHLSRMEPSERARLACEVERFASPVEAEAVRRGVHPRVSVKGVIGLAPVGELGLAAREGLSDFHDASINFMCRAGATEAEALAGLAGLGRTEGRDLPTVPLLTFHPSRSTHHPPLTPCSPPTTPHVPSTIRHSPPFTTHHPTLTPCSPPPTPHIPRIIHPAPYSFHPSRSSDHRLLTPFSLPFTPHTSPFPPSFCYIPLMLTSHTLLITFHPLLTIHPSLLHTFHPSPPASPSSTPHLPLLR